MTSSISLLWFILCTSNPVNSVPTMEYFSRFRHYVDVRDVGEAHVRALEVEEAGGERFLLSAGTLRATLTWLLG